MGFVLGEIDHITELKSEIHYIKRFFGRVNDTENDLHKEFYIFFSLEYQAIGPPLVDIKFIDHPSEDIINARADIEKKILQMEKSGTLVHSPFTGL